MTTNKSRSIRLQRGARRFRNAIALVALAVLPGVTSASAASDDDLLYVACMRSTSASPDSLEHWIDWCADIASDAHPRYVACMQSTSASPDSLERWIGWCIDTALG